MQLACKLRYPQHAPAVTAAASAAVDSKIRTLNPIPRAVGRPRDSRPLRLKRTPNSCQTDCAHWDAGAGFSICCVRLAGCASWLTGEVPPPNGARASYGPTDGKRFHWRVRRQCVDVIVRVGFTRKADGLPPSSCRPKARRRSAAAAAAAGIGIADDSRLKLQTRMLFVRHGIREIRDERRRIRARGLPHDLFIGFRGIKKRN